MKSELYIGCKIVRAFPKTIQEFSIDFRDTNKSFNLPINDVDVEGYQVEYPDGYISWCPKEVFENANRKVTKEEMELLNNN